MMLQPLVKEPEQKDNDRIARVETYRYNRKKECFDAMNPLLRSPLSLWYTVEHVFVIYLLREAAFHPRSKYCIINN